MQIKPFKGYRPRRELVAEVASRPYDVLSTAEARMEAAGNPRSFLHVTKPELAFPDDTPPDSPEIYQAAARSFQGLVDNGAFVQDEREHLYVYELSRGLSRNGHVQTGLVAVAAVQDYLDGRIRKHELTRPDKEADRARHIGVTMLNVEPVMFAYRHDPAIDKLIDSIKSAPPEYDFVDADSVRHRFWIVADPDAIAALVDAFADVPRSYVADGHHRSAAAARVSRELNSQEQYRPGGAQDYFLAVHFPDNQLEILDYNRLVTDLNGLDAGALLHQLVPAFMVERTGNQAVRPRQRGVLGMYLAGSWYRLGARPGSYDADDHVAALGVSILSDLVLAPALGIHDQRTDPRIHFVGGARPIEELSNRVDSGEMAVAFTTCPVSVQELMHVADAGNIMPPKATWFEPKLRSGLVVYGFGERFSM